MLWQSTCRVSHAKNACSFVAKNLRAHQVRYLTLPEYQAYNLLRQHNVPVPKGKLARTRAEVRACIESLGGSAMIKAQVLQSGGRGRGTFDSGLKGSIQRVTSAGDGEGVAAKMLGHSLPTSQTAYGGPLVRQLYVVEDISPKEEWYVAITVDRERYCPILILSKKGGADIETIVRQSPEGVITIPLQYDAGINAEVLRSIQEQLAIPESAVESLEKTLTSLWTIFSEKDAILLELNPLALLSSDKFMPLGARFTFDDAAARRQPELFAMRDVEDEIPEEVEAEKYGLVYVRLDGNIGNVVNGAGLAMATNDAIGLHGGASANFLDAGGQATKETMIQAFRIILADQRVKAILVNIYGGITKCDMIAKSILGAASELGPITVPIVARLQGTNSTEGLRLLEEADLGIHVEAGFGEAAKKAVELAETNRLGAA